MWIFPVCEQSDPVQIYSTSYLFWLVRLQPPEGPPLDADYEDKICIASTFFTPSTPEMEGASSEDLVRPTLCQNYLLAYPKKNFFRSR